MGPWLLYSSISVVNIDTFDGEKSRTVFLYSIQPNIFDENYIRFIWKDCWKTLFVGSTVFLLSLLVSLDGWSGIYGNFCLKHIW